MVQNKHIVLFCIFFEPDFKYSLSLFSKIRINIKKKNSAEMKNINKFRIKKKTTRESRYVYFKYVELILAKESFIIRISTNKINDVQSNLN